jgi:hypothetical protein
MPTDRNGSPQYHAPEAVPYILQFEQMYNKDVSTIKVEIEDKGFTNDRTLAYCVSTGSIVIRPFAWNAMSSVSKRSLVFHELGHCVLNRKHNDDLYPDGCPKSIMSTYLVTDFCFNSHANEIDYELGVGR